MLQYQCPDEEPIVTVGEVSTLRKPSLDDGLIDSVRVQLVRGNPIPFGKRIINNSGDAANLAIKLIGNEDREHVLGLLLDVKNQVTAVHTISIGCLDYAPMSTREVFKAAILANAASIILAHNHPSGNPEPSPDDLKATKQLAVAGHLLGIELVDHLVIGEECFVSLRSRGDLFSA